MPRWPELDRTLDARHESACTPQTDTDAFRFVSSVGRPHGFSFPPPSASGPMTFALRERPHQGSPFGDPNNTAPPSPLRAGSLPLLRLSVISACGGSFSFFPLGFGLFFPPCHQNSIYLREWLPQGTMLLLSRRLRSASI